MYLLVFIAIGVTGLLLQRYLVKQEKGVVALSIIWLLGVYVTILSFYLLSLFVSLSATLGLYIVALCIICIKTKIISRALLNSIISWHTVLYVLGVFTFYIIFARSFSYDTKNHDFLISSNIYQDFGAHISFIRSFSLGLNIPFEVPFYGAGGLMYHFMFYFFAGVLEYFGMRIDIALNTISAVSFVSLLVMIFAIGHKLFKSVWVGILADILILFNSSLSFLNFFKIHSIDIHFPIAIWRNSLYQTQTLFLGEKVDVFWNLNTYLNQRHFIFGSLYVLFILLQLINVVTEKKQDKKKLWILSALTGMLVFWHALAFLALLMLISLFIILFPQVRKLLIQFFCTALIVSSPFLFLIKMHSSNSITFHIGFLSSKTDIVHILTYWIINLGFVLLPLIFVFRFLTSVQRRIYVVIMSLFIVPNIINFSTRFLYDNHKFFNLWILCVSIFIAHFILVLFKKGPMVKFFSFLLILLCTLSGVIDLFVIKNDVYAHISDYQYTQSYDWIKKNTDKRSIFLTNGEIYDPLSLVGRKTYLGREFYLYVYGANPEKRMKISQDILSGGKVDRVSIDYIVVYKSSDIKNRKTVNKTKLDQLHKKIYEDTQTLIYKI